MDSSPIYVVLDLTNYVFINSRNLIGCHAINVLVNNYLYRLDRYIYIMQYRYHFSGAVEQLTLNNWIIILHFSA